MDIKSNNPNYTGFSNRLTDDVFLSEVSVLFSMHRTDDEPVTGIWFCKPDVLESLLLVTRGTLAVGLANIQMHYPLKMVLHDVVCILGV